MSDLFKEKILDFNLKNQEKDLSKSENKECIQVGTIAVEIEYSNDNKSINECMINLLRHKIQEF